MQVLLRRFSNMETWLLWGVLHIWGRGLLMATPDDRNDLIFSIVITASPKELQEQAHLIAENRLTRLSSKLNFLVIGHHCPKWLLCFLPLFLKKIWPHNVNRVQMKERIEVELPEFHVQICEECSLGHWESTVDGLCEVCIFTSRETG